MTAHGKRSSGWNLSQAPLKQLLPILASLTARECLQQVAAKLFRHRSQLAMRQLRNRVLLSTCEIL